MMRWGYLAAWTLASITAGVAGCGAGDALTSTQSTLSSTTSSMKSGENDYKTNSTEAKDRAGNKGQQSGQQGGGGGGSGGTFTSNGDPDSDGTRGESKEGKPNEAFNDEVGKKKLDYADWKKWQLEGKPQAIKVKLRWDDPKAELTVEVFDAFGESVASNMGKHKAPERLLTTTIVQPGLYYTKVSCMQSGKDFIGTQYTMKLMWEGAPAPGPASAATPAAPACNGPPCVPGQIPCGQPGQPACAAGQVSCCPPQGPMAQGAAQPPAGPNYPVAGDPKHPRCKVVQSVRDDDGSLLLFLDRGSDAGFRVGGKGTLLQGKDGDIPLDGGEFTITKVIDKQKSVAKCYVSSVGKNNRARVDLVPWHP
jgi:hypothetical protein